MHRVLFKLGSLPIYSYGIMILVAFGMALIFARKRATRFGMTSGQVIDVAFWLLVAGVIGARLGFIVQEIGYYRTHVNELLSWQFQGLTSYGGIAGGLIVLLIYAKRTGKSVWTLLDLFSAPFLVGNAIGRVGCLLNGCCYGGQCTLPWAVHVEDQSLPGHMLPGLYHPAQIYESLMNIAGLLILLWIERRGLKPGQSIGAMLVLFGIGRFIYEFWRAGSTSTYMGSLPITDAQLVALILVVSGIIGYIRFGYSAASPKKESNEAGPST